MEAGEVVPETAAAPFDPSEIHKALDQAEALYHSTFAGHVADEVHRFGAFLSTVRMIVDQSADSASKE